MEELICSKCGCNGAHLVTIKTDIDSINRIFLCQRCLPEIDFLGKSFNVCEECGLRYNYSCPCIRGHAAMFFRENGRDGFNLKDAPICLEDVIIKRGPNALQLESD